MSMVAMMISPNLVNTNLGVDLGISEYQAGDFLD
jgi:hypothetical protein